jgi:hypothetical protein
MKFKQCYLSRIDAEGMYHYSSVWLPEIFCHIGKHIKIKSKTEDSWSGVWKVDEVYGSVSFEEAEVDHNEREYKYHRKRTDI